MAEKQAISDKPSPGNFLRAFGYHWSDYMTGAPSIFLVLIAVFLPLMGIQDKTTVTIISVGTGLTGILCGVIASYKIWQRERHRVNELEEKLTPKFSLRFDASENCIDKTTVIERNALTGVPTGREWEATYLRIRIEPISDTTIAECRAWIVKIEHILNDGHAMDLHVPHNMWIRSEIPFRVYPCVHEVADFLECHEHRSGPNLAGYAPNALIDAFEAKGKYRFKIAVNGDGVTKAISVEVDWKGHWSNVTAEQVV